MAIEAFGVRIGVELPGPELVGPALERFPPTWRTTDFELLDRLYWIELVSDTHRSMDRYRLHADGVQLLSRDDLDGVMEELESSIQIFVAEFATPHLFVHAGVVEWRGRAIVLPGSSFAGKSTLVAALVNAGATYFSDEYAVFDVEGRVLPYRRRISLRKGPLGPAGRIERAETSSATLPHSGPSAMRTALRTHLRGWDALLMLYVQCA